MHRIARSLLLILVLLVSAGAGPARADEPKVVLFEDPALEANRLHYPLLISDGRGYRIRCKDQADEEAVIRGLGFATVPSEVLTAVDSAIVAADPATNPLLCPSGETYPIKVFAHDNGSGLVFYLQFPSDFGATTFSDRLYIPGCAPLVTELKLNLDQALNADPTPFFAGKIHTITCLSGAPLVDKPTTFTKWCVKGDRTPAETATVMAVLDATPGGVSALGNPAACAAAQTFLESITTLNLNGKGVQSLEPIAVLANLTSLSIADNSISDLGPLTKLKALTFLDISGNHVGNINALAPLIALTRADVSDNDIIDIRALSALALLTNLTLDNNKIASLEPLQFLQVLSTLSIANNGLTGDMLDPLSALGGLTSLNLANNKIETFANLGSFPSTLAINLSGNPIVANGGQSFVDLCVLHRDAPTPLGQTIRAMVELEGGGTCAAVGNNLLATTALDLSSKIISDLRPIATLPQLTSLNLSSNAITDVAPLAGLANLGILNLSKNSIVNVRPLAALSGLINLDLSDNPVQATDFLSACLMRKQTDFLTPAQAAEVNALLSISGKAACGKAYDDLNSRQFADAKNRGLTSVSLFPVMANLTSIDLSDNQLSDVSALSAVPGLTKLWIRNNQIPSIQGVLQLRRLEQLNIDGNPLSNLIGIGMLNKLTKLYFSNTHVQSVTPLADLPLLDDAGMRNLPLQYASFAEYCIVYRFDSIALGDARGFMAALESRMQADHVDSADCSAAQNWAQSLTSLSLNKKSIIAVNPVVHFRALGELNLFDNVITDASPIASLTGLQKLNLATNRLSKIPRFGSNGLKYIYLNDNQITDVGNLSNMPALSNVDLRNNRVFNALPLGSLPALSVVDLRGNRIENFVHVHPVIGKSYLGNNPICSFPQPLAPPVAEACKREPLRIFDVNIHVFDEIAVQPSINCRGPNCLQLQPHVILGPLIHQ
ncbi:MAG: leucine-rich repeat domain-containing protein [Mesorhizobium sp.]|uniref:leucine-rich repeat domain-containing protein n=1 Tax=Mesorhizobium sp. TaxID=1871066 RepID=UPI00120DA329|nr:leucine-rich repeat domain-containing protein [Mesorhizobium sp.]TIO50385.1 MAG: leucine-rich repeat domain-containing protein [Mesorhizobium sp.]TIO59709.1 MAG: leucine-rich repeat domain-containing protein [Mesorhizobium sp.]TJV65483.1 MAG: leucine-rich repeat domain-containing protein [Mesorhizobium sp.]